MKSYKNEFRDFQKIPKTSGLYYVYDKNDNLLYIGKAVSLYSRINMHHSIYLQHKERMFFRKIARSKGWKSKEEADEKFRESTDELDFKAMSWVTPSVIDFVFEKIKRIEIEEMPEELIKSKEKEMILKFEPPLNYETRSEEYDRLREEGE